MKNINRIIFKVYCFSLQVYGNSTSTSVKVFMHHFPRQNHNNHRLDIVIYFGSANIKGTGKNHVILFGTNRFTVFCVKLLFIIMLQIYIQDKSKKSELPSIPDDFIMSLVYFELYFKTYLHCIEKRKTLLGFGLQVP